MTPQSTTTKRWWAPRNWSEEQALRVAQEVYRLRGSRSAQWLANRTAELGHEVSRSLIADLENGRRRYVTVAELMVLAYALDTAPIALFYPPPYDELIRALPDHVTTKFEAAESFCANDDGLIGPTYTQALQRARDIASAKETQRALLELLQDIEEKRIPERFRVAPKAVEGIRRELSSTVRQIKVLEAEVEADGR
ncbi:hypothetical protein A5660_25030 [Mycobacterium alsense]|uniref:hypothetical protein n=1 Tax=Mycobacterium alsense TaxID=324058 RepID=UPI0007FCAE2F|nr:hypothetical protein [Mycobacterium alsense]OBJ00360.1 hypothetical protein A5660_25030 [Mycobacterium alsense]